MCNPIPRRINGVNCNDDVVGSISGSASGYCSGFSYGNIAEDYWYHSQGVCYPALHPLVEQYSSLIYCPLMTQETLFQRAVAQHSLLHNGAVQYCTGLHNAVQRSAVLQEGKIHIYPPMSYPSESSWIQVTWGNSPLEKKNGEFSYTRELSIGACFTLHVHKSIHFPSLLPVYRRRPDHTSTTHAAT